MPEMQRTVAKRVMGPAAVLLLASLLLAACGGGSSSSSSSKTSTGSATTPTTTSTASPGSAAAPATASGSPRFAKLRACMQRQGIALPQGEPGKAAPSAGGALGAEGGPQLPKGVSRARFDAALGKCGARSFGGTGLAAGRMNSPEFRQALARFANCMRQQGVDIPAPKVAGSGPVFTTKGLKTGSPQFLSAERKCSAIIAQAFRRARGSNPPGTNPGAPGPLGAVPTPKQ